MIKFYKKSLVWGPSAAGWPLGNALGITKKALLSPNSTRELNGALILNWGVSTSPPWSDPYYIWLNCPWNIGISANKTRMMDAFLSAGIPSLTVVKKEEVYPDTILVARHLLSSHSGLGIEIAKASEIGNAPLYTILEDFKVEQRIFIVNNRIVDIVQKKKMGKAKLTAMGLEKADPYVKSHRKGWVFARNDIEETPAMAKEIAIEAMIAVGLEFGCVDVAWSNPNKCRVIETNSTPGFKNTITLEKFANAIREEFL